MGIFQKSIYSTKINMKIFKFLGFFCLLAVQAEKCTFDECVSCSFVDANPTFYPDLKSLCASMKNCCASSYQVDLKKVIGNYGGLVNKKLDEEFKKLLEQRISLETAKVEMRVAEKKLFSRDENDNSDLVQSSSKGKFVPFEKKNTYIGIKTVEDMQNVKPVKNLEDANNADGKIWGKLSDDLEYDIEILKEDLEITEA